MPVQKQKSGSLTLMSLLERKTWLSLYDNKKIKSIGGLSSIFIIFLLVLLSRHIKTSEYETEVINNDSPRGIASARSLENNDFNSQWKKKVASQIAETTTIPSGRISRQPNPLERLVFEDLKGYYLLHMEGMKIKDMQLDQKYNSKETPRYLGEETVFLNSHRELWWVSFNSVELRERKDNKTIMILLNSSNKEVGEAQFTWDDDGHMTSLVIDKK